MKTQTDTTKNNLSELNKRLVNLMGVELIGLTIDEISDIDSAIQVTMGLIRATKMGDFADSLEKKRKQDADAIKVAQKKAQDEALQFYGDERYLHIELRKVTSEGKYEVETTGSIPLRNPESKNPPVHTGINKEGKVTQTRGNHLELRNDNTSFEYKGERVANFDIKLRIGKPEFVEYRKPKVEKSTIESMTSKGSRQADKQRKHNKADELQTAVTLPPKVGKPQKAVELSDGNGVIA